MPMIDMPLEKLKEYKGINPRPADFDKYWDESIAEMNALDPRLQLHRRILHRLLQIATTCTIQV